MAGRLVLVATQEWTTPGIYSWNVPAGVYFVWVVAAAGGGGGGSSVKGAGNTAGGGGGGSGESCHNEIVGVTPLGTLDIEVGAGGVAGQFGVLATNVHAGPEGNTSSGSGFGGDDTVIGPIKLKGGYGGIQGNAAGSNPHSGRGGGAPSSATQALSSGGFGGDGLTPTTKCNRCFWGGSGGGAGSRIDGGTGLGVNGGNGAACGPFAGGVGGTASATAGGGGGGGATIFGPGGAGGNADSAATAVPAGSYGAGGGGGGGNSTLGTPLGNAFLGANGADGYVALFYLIWI